MEATLHTLIEPHKPRSIMFHMLKDVPPPTFLQVLIELCDVFLRLRDTAKTEKRNNAVHTSLLDLTDATIGSNNLKFANVFYSSGDDVVNAI